MFPLNVPKVRNEVDTEHLKEAPLRDSVGNTSRPKYDANVGDKDLATVVRAEHDGGRVEVCKDHSVHHHASNLRR